LAARAGDFHLEQVVVEETTAAVGLEQQGTLGQEGCWDACPLVELLLFSMSSLAFQTNLLCLTTVESFFLLSFTTAHIEVEDAKNSNQRSKEGDKAWHFVDSSYVSKQLGEEGLEEVGL